MRLTNAYAVTLNEKHIIIICWSKETAEKWKEYYKKNINLNLYKIDITEVSVEDPAQYISELATDAGLDPDDYIDFISPIAVAVRAMQQINMLSFIEMARAYLSNQHSITYRLPLKDPNYKLYVSTLAGLLENIKRKE